MAGGIKETTVGIMPAITAASVLLLLAAATAGHPSSVLRPLPGAACDCCRRAAAHQALVAGGTLRLGSVVTKAVVGEQSRS